MHFREIVDDAGAQDPFEYLCHTKKSYEEVGELLEAFNERERRISLDLALV